MKNNCKLIIDFDSTFIKTEALEELADIVLDGRADKEIILKKIKEITDLGMLGKMSFPDSLKQRLDLLSLDRESIDKLITRLKTKISDSFLQNKEFFLKNKNNIYIISGGFTDFIIPTVSDFAIPDDHVLANNFIFDDNGKVIGINKDNFLAQENGKVRQVQALGFEDEVIVLGDGWTDYEIKQAGLADKFIAFTENISRGKVVDVADFVVGDFGEVIQLGIKN